MATFTKSILIFALAINLLSVIVYAQMNASTTEKPSLITKLVKGTTDGLGNLVGGPLNLVGDLVIGTGEAVEGLGQWLQPKKKDN